MRLLQPAFVRDIAASPRAITSRRRAAAGGSHEWADAGLAALCVADQRPATRFHPQRAVIGRSVEGPTVGTDWSHVAAPQPDGVTRAPPLERMSMGHKGRGRFVSGSARHHHHGARDGHRRTAARAPDPLCAQPAEERSRGGGGGLLKEFGWRQPIVVEEEMVILTGHTRLERRGGSA